MRKQEQEGWNARRRRWHSDDYAIFQSHTQPGQLTAQRPRYIASWHSVAQSFSVVPLRDRQMPFFFIIAAASANYNIKSKEQLSNINKSIFLIMRLSSPVICQIAASAACFLRRQRRQRWCQGIAQRLPLFEPKCFLFSTASPILSRRNCRNHHPRGESWPVLLSALFSAMAERGKSVICCRFSFVVWFLYTFLFPASFRTHEIVSAYRGVA